MPNPFFRFKQFTIYHDRCAMKVTTDACLFGAWVAQQLLSQHLTAGKLLDVGTGTGLLSLMVAQKNTGTIDAVEIDGPAAGQAVENVDASPWKDRIRILHTDLLQWKTAGQYDCIFSNPPFFENDLLSGKNSKNLAHHDKGLKLQDLFQFIQAHLKDDGHFFLLLPLKRGPETDVLLTSHGLHVQQKVMVQQTPAHSPFRVMIQGGRKEFLQITERELVIKNREEMYTTDFTGLLQDYYLYL